MLERKSMRIKTKTNFIDLMVTETNNSCQLGTGVVIHSVVTTEDHLQSRGAYLIA